jgi:AcrR family transcriptional regulator
MSERREADAPTAPETRERARERILAAASRVYAKHGSLGATTRHIAAEAGVNEVTLFRIFGSKEALLDEAIHQCSATEPGTPLPERPANPQRELAEWCRRELARLSRLRNFLQQCFADSGGHPKRSLGAGTIVEASAVELRRYTAQLDELGLTKPGGNRPVAIAMLLSVLLADALAREELGGALPSERDDLPGLYADTFLAALGCSTDARVSTTG